MGMRETCPACENYNSDIYYAFSQGFGCPECKASPDLIENIKSIRAEKASRIREKLDKELTEENFRLKKEFLIFQDRKNNLNDKMANIFSQLTDILLELEYLEGELLK